MTSTPSTPRELVVVGWDGASKPMLRYRDELKLPDHARSIVSAEDRAAYEERKARPNTVEQLRAVLEPLSELVAYRRVSADLDLFIVATKRYGRVAIGELDLGEVGDDSQPGRYWPLEDLGAAPTQGTIGVGLDRGHETVLDRLLGEGLYPEPTRNPRLAELRLRAIAGDDLAQRAVKAYATDAELEAAEAESNAADFTS